ncbi:hypothetical protein LTR86_011022 [Recurvomyces mirabilis]|nr:hypothetical protein LTR86_011022 [Recurvomyces mirabilis]
MALWEGSFRDMDPITLSTIIQIQLQDSQELATKTKGKQREGTVTDGELAFQVYVEELTNIDSVLSVRKMAQSLTTAVLLDGHFIQREHELEDQVFRDRQFACSIQGDETLVNPISKPRYQGEHHVWVNDEYLAKLAAIYMREPSTPSGTTPPPLTFDSDSDGTMVESSQRAATREKKRQPKKGHLLLVERIWTSSTWRVCHAIMSTADPALANSSSFPSQTNHSFRHVATAKRFL